MILNFVYSSNTMSCIVSTLFRFVGGPLPVYRADFQPKSHMFKFFSTYFSASTGGHDFKFIYSINTMSCTVSPLFRFVGGLLPVYRADLCNFQLKSTCSNLSKQISLLLLDGMILNFVYSFNTMSCTMLILFRLADIYFLFTEAN